MSMLCGQQKQGMGKHKAKEHHRTQAGPQKGRGAVGAPWSSRFNCALSFPQEVQTGIISDPGVYNALPMAPAALPCLHLWR